MIDNNNMVAKITIWGGGHKKLGNFGKFCVYSVNLSNLANFLENFTKTF
jgi:hypothetical protein